MKIKTLCFMVYTSLYTFFIVPAKSNNHYTLSCSFERTVPSSRLVQSFLYAIEHHDKEEFDTLLLCEASLLVNCKNEKGLTPLMMASKVGSEYMVITLLARGAHVNTIADDGLTAILVASATGRLPIVMLLHQAGAHLDIPHCSLDQSTPLITASVRGYNNIVEYLASQPEQQDFGRALRKSIAVGQVKAVEILLNKFEYPKKTITAAIQYAQQLKFENIVKLLQRHQTIDQVCNMYKHKWPVLVAATLQRQQAISQPITLPVATVYPKKKLPSEELVGQSKTILPEIHASAKYLSDDWFESSLSSEPSPSEKLLPSLPRKDTSWKDDFS